jgi:hypothetical protein
VIEQFLSLYWYYLPNNLYSISFDFSAAEFESVFQMVYLFRSSSESCELPIQANSGCRSLKVGRFEHLLIDH